MSAPHFDTISKYINDVNFCVSDFATDLKELKVFSPKDFNSKADDTNKVYCKDASILAGLQLNIQEKSKNSVVIVGDGVKFKGCKITITNNDTFVYIGSHSKLTNLTLVIQGKEDFVVIGSNVSVTSNSTWNTGINSGQINNGIIVGDHCLFASEIVIRAADGHMILDIENKQINISKKPVILEPYCWIGQRATILKNVRIGACSIISLGAIVTKSAPKFSSLSGVPANIKSLDGKFWLRSNSESDKKIMQFYKEKFFTKVESVVRPHFPVTNEMYLSRIDSVLQSWAFRELKTKLFIEFKNDKDSIGNVVKYLLDLGEINDITGLIAKFEVENSIKIESYTPARNAANWNAVTYFLDFQTKLSLGGNTKNSAYYCDLYDATKCKNTSKATSLLESDLHNHINKDISPEENLVISSAINMLINEKALSEKAAITITNHVYHARNINKIRKRYILQRLVENFTFEENTNFFNLPKARTNHLYKLLASIQSYANNEVGAQALSSLLTEKIRTNNNLSIASKKKRRVAICVSGMMKIDDAAIKSLFEKMATPLEADVFIHTWDKIQLWSGDARKSGFWSRQFKLPLHTIPEEFKDMDTCKDFLPNTCEILLSTITDDTLKHLCSGYHKKAASFLVENEEEALAPWKSNSNFMSRGHMNQFKMYYGINKCFELMKKYEEKNNFKYDIVIRTRPDLFITEEMDRSRLDSLQEGSIAVNVASVGPNDGFFYALRQDYEKVVSIWSKILDSEHLSPFYEFPEYDSHVLLLAWLIHKNLDVRGIGKINYDLAKSSSLAQIPGLSAALEKDLSNFEPSKLSQDKYAALFGFLRERSI
ncbi:MULTISPECIES: acyltransferase [Aeromonas]|uniref:acyltransferase n=1 Tax=Aeromonas TaxID=642 RepID=UPI002974D1E2|nr:acyltransferase [Aeromonas rivipollensis]